MKTRIDSRADVYFTIYHTISCSHEANIEEVYRTAAGESLRNTWYGFDKLLLTKIQEQDRCQQSSSTCYEREASESDFGSFEYWIDRGLDFSTRQVNPIKLSISTFASVNAEGCPFKYFL